MANDSDFFFLFLLFFRAGEHVRMFSRSNNLQVAMPGATVGTVSAAMAYRYAPQPTTRSSLGVKIWRLAP